VSDHNQTDSKLDPEGNLVISQDYSLNNSLHECDHIEPANLGLIDILANYKYSFWKLVYGTFYNYEGQDLEEKSRSHLTKNQKFL
jgi:hypothetical protein